MVTVQESTGEIYSALIIVTRGYSRLSSLVNQDLNAPGSHLTVKVMMMTQYCWWILTTTAKVLSGMIEWYDTHQIFFRGTTLLKLSLLPAMPYNQYNPRFEISAIILGLCLRKYFVKIKGSL